MFCDNCGANITKHTKYCEQCGVPIRNIQWEDTVEKPKSHAAWVIGGIAGGISVVVIIIAVLFAGGIIQIKDKADTGKREYKKSEQAAERPVATHTANVTASPPPKPTAEFNPVKQWDTDENKDLQENTSKEANQVSAHSLNVEAVVQHARDIYYGTNKKLKKYSVNKVEKEYADYYDNEKNVLRKAITYPTSSGDGYIKNYVAEYYYDDTQKLVFAFAYKKVKGKTKEYRAYYGTDGKLYRYIDASGKVSDYKNGVPISSPSSKLKYELYNKGTYYLHLALD